LEPHTPKAVVRIRDITFFLSAGLAFVESSAASMYRSVESLLPMRAMAFPMLGRLMAPGRARDSSTWWVLLEV
jgi:hypothetical protein